VWYGVTRHASQPSFAVSTGRQIDKIQTVRYCTVPAVPGGKYCSNVSAQESHVSHMLCVAGCDSQIDNG
jgi:hypothetical protein